MNRRHIPHTEIKMSPIRVGTMFLGLFLVAGPQPARAIEHDKPYGEPYELAGKRLVFTTWYWVRPGKLDWRDADANSVYASDTKHGPWESHFHTEDVPYGIRLVAETAQRTGPVISRDRPWEKMGISVGTLIHEDGKYRLWATCQDVGGKRRSCYFESTDGRSWQRPNLGLVEFDGSRRNNLIPAELGTVFIDPVSGPDERYKSVRHGDCDPALFPEYKKRRPWSVMATETDPDRAHAILADVSADGYRWKQLPEPISVEPSDTQIVAYYDPRLKKYVIYTRSYMIGPRAEGYPLRHQRWHQFAHRRAIGRAETDHFRAFPLSRTIIEAGNDMLPTDTFYTNCRTTIPGAPDHHLMFPAVYHQADDTSSIDLYTSYDGRLWHRVPGSPVLKTSDFGHWDGGCIFAHPNLVELPDGSWALPYTGYVYPHKYPRGAWAYDAGMAVWPKGRLMALEAEEEGAFTTLAFLVPGVQMRINAVTRRAGSILVEVADFSGKPLPGRGFVDAVPIIGDQYRTLVTWKSSDGLGVKEGEPIVLRFRMNKAKIYGLEFE